jgi:hypothetical protein
VPVSTIKKPLKRPNTLSTTPDLLRKPIAERKYESKQTVLTN